MDQIKDYSDVIVISDDDDAVNSEFKDKDNLGGKENHLMPKIKKESERKKKKYHNYIKTEIDVFEDYVWKSIIEIPDVEIPDNSIITQNNTIETTFHCHYCVKSFPVEHLLKKHLKTHKQLRNTNKKMICKFCGKLFRCRFQLKTQAFRKTCDCEVISIN